MVNKIQETPGSVRFQPVLVVPVPVPPVPVLIFDDFGMFFDDFDVFLTLC